MRRKAVFAALLAAVGLFGYAPAFGQNTAEQVSPRTIDIAAHVAEAAQRFGLPESWIYAVMRTESAGRISAVSSAGAMGLMQLMPGTWARQRARFGLGADPFDPRDNIIAGTSYLREMYDSYGASGFLAAYNAGPGRYEDWRDRGRPLPALAPRNARARARARRRQIRGLASRPVREGAVAMSCWLTLLARWGRTANDEAIAKMNRRCRRRQCVWSRRHSGAWVDKYVRMRVCMRV